MTKLKIVLLKTLGGLSASYYFRNFIFGLLFPSLLIFITLNGGNKNQLSFSFISMATLNTILYPYSRFVYESIIDFIIGNNIFFGNAIVIITAKIITMLFCWVFAMFIAPIGLVYLYFYHSRAQARSESDGCN